MTAKDLTDGSALQQSWHLALSDALRTFRQLSAAPSTQSSRPWKLVPSSTASASAGPATPVNGARRDLPFLDGEQTSELTARDVVVHRKAGKRGDTYRAVLDVPLLESDREWYDVEVFKGLLQTPETMSAWDNMVEGGSTLDVPDVNTRVCRTRYRLGWPANPRDTITISKTFCDGHSLIWVSTSLPRSASEPPHLRPAPPYVRAHMALQAFHVQCIPVTHVDGDATPGTSRETLRVTCFWSWDPKGSWMIGGSLAQHLPGVLVGLVRHAKSSESRIPTLAGFGTGVVLSDLALEPKRNLLECRYVVVAEDDEGDHAGAARSLGSLEGAEALEMIKERRRLFRAVEFALSPMHAWDVQITARHSSSAISDPEWTTFVGRYLGPNSPPRLVLRCTHAHLGSKDDLARVSLAIERTTGTFGVRINGMAAQIEELEPRTKMTVPLPLSLAESGSALSGVSVAGLSETTSVLNAVDEVLAPVVLANHALSGPATGLKRRRSGKVKRSAAEEKQISALIKRNYIYFTSLLQEPEAKWKPLNESKGVALHQLRSIDSTLNIVRAEAVFVGVGIWDIFAVIANWGAGPAWDAVADDAILLEDLNEFSELWWLKGKGAWSTVGRENVVLRTVYKTAESMHLVSMSVNDKHLFPRAPDVQDGSLRLQTDVQGWAIESLSSNTVQLSLLEQRDARSKSSLPLIISAVGEQAIKQGAPPIITSLTGAKQIASRFDGEIYRLEYEASAAAEAVRPSLRPTDSMTTSVVPLGREATPSVHSVPSTPSDRIESQIRCDCEVSTAALEVTIDPPPLQVSSLKRHRVSGFGGLWITIEHDRTELGYDKVSVLIKRGKSSDGSRSKGGLLVNGHKIDVQVEETAPADLEAAMKQRRGKPQRQPLDRPSLPALRRRTNVTRQDSQDDVAASAPRGMNVRPNPPVATTGLLSGLPTWTYPLGSLYGIVSEATRSALVPVASQDPSGDLPPVTAAEGALRQVFLMNEDRSNEADAEREWTTAGRQADGYVLEKRASGGNSAATFYRTTGILRGSSAKEVLSLVQNGPGGRHKWDDRSLGETAVASFGNGIDVRWKVQAAAVLGLPMRSRGFLVTGMTAADTVPSSSSSVDAAGQTSFQDRYYVASTSAFNRKELADSKSFNPTQIAEGRVVLEGWIIEDLDPYSPETYDIPSAKVTYISAYDFGGLPLAVNNTLNYNRHCAILPNVQRLLKTVGPRESVRYPPAGMRLVVGGDDNDVEGDGAHLLTQRFDSAESTSTTVLVKSRATFGPIDVPSAPPRHLRTESQNRFSTWRSQARTDASEDPTATIVPKPRLDVTQMHVECREAKMDFEVSVEAHWAVSTTNEVPSLEQAEQVGAPLKIPFVAEVFDAPRSLLRTAGAEPHIKAFLIQIAIEISPSLEGLSVPNNKTEIRPFVPAWLASLRTRGCVVTLKIRRNKPDVVAADGVRFIWKGQPMTVQGAQAKEGTEQSRLWPTLDVNRIRNAPITIRQDNRQPLAVSSSRPPADVIAPPAKDAEKGQDAAPSASPHQRTALPPRSPQAVGTTEDKFRPPPPRRTSLYSFFAYPSAASSRRTTMPTIQPTDTAVHASLGNGDDGAAGHQWSPALNVNSQASIWSLQLPLYAVLCLAAACFLAGSLLRSLLAHSEDYIMFLPAGADTSHIVAPTDWTEMRKLMQIPFFRWDVVVGVVRAAAR